MGRWFGYILIFGFREQRVRLWLIDYTHRKSIETLGGRYDFIAGRFGATLHF